MPFLKDIVSALNDPEIIVLLNLKNPTSIESALEELGNLNQSENVVFAICNHGKFVGQIGMHSICGEQATVGFFIIRECWGHGYGTQANKLLFKEATQRGISKLIAEVKPLNTRSLSCLKKCGYILVETGELHRYEKDL